MAIHIALRRMLVLVLYCTSVSEGSVVENQLVSRLFENYSTIVRPVANVAEPLKVKLALTLMQLLELSCTNGGLMRIVIWRTLEWTDASLVWDPYEYENMTTVRIPYSKIWKPDVYVYNSASEEFGAAFKTEAIVRRSGDITIIDPQILTTNCRFSYSYFPFDHQKCEIKFGSWTYDGGELDLTLQDPGGSTGDISSFIQNPQWELIAFPARRNAIYYACCPDPYIDITFVVHVKRRGEGILAGAQRSNIFIFMTLFLSFLIPPASGHKITFAILHLINSWHPVYYYNWVFPGLLDGPDRGGPLMYYFNWVGLLGAIGLFANIITVCLFHTAWDMPHWIRKHVSKRTRNGVPSSLEISGSPKRLDEEKYVADEKSPASGLNEWQYISLQVNRVFLILFMLFATIIWITCFPSFSDAT